VTDSEPNDAVETETVETKPVPAEPMMTARPPTPRTAADGYAFAAVTCAAAGLLLPIAISLISGLRGFISFAIVLLSAPASLMLARATEEPIAAEPVSPGVARIAGIAQTLAYASLALVAAFCAALLLGILGKVLTS
jgi:hypothetical protein